MWFTYGMEFNRMRPEVRRFVEEYSQLDADGIDNERYTLTVERQFLSMSDDEVDDRLTALDFVRGV